MKPGGQVSTYFVPEVPDPACPAYRAAAGGDVRRAVATAGEHLLRTLAHMPAGSCSADLVFAFDPARDKRGRRQSRLELYVRLRACSPAMARGLNRLLCGGPLSLFYRFERAQNIPDQPASLDSVCSIVRRVELIRPLHTCDLNYKIPDRYYTLRSFVANEHNDWMMLDCLFDGIDEPVRIRIGVRPVDISAQLHAHTEYLARLQSINHGPEMDDEELGSIDLGGSGGHGYVALQNRLSPLSRKDPLANDIFRTAHEIHRTLPLPHLSFRIQVAARTEPVAQLICTSVAESGFDEGSYRIVGGQQGCPEWDDVDTVKEQSVAGRPATAQHGDDSGEYEQLQPLSQVATVDELLGIFGLPIASVSSPLCCRKNTDPPDVCEKDLIPIGHDERSLAGNGAVIPRGIRVETLAKHLSCFGLPGMGKTTSNINVLLQLSQLKIPFLVIECAKREYRVLKTFANHERRDVRELARKLQIYTVGAEQVSPFRFNFLEILRGVEVSEQIESIMYCIKASIPVSAGSLPALLLEALEELCEGCTEREHPPVVAELIGMIETVLARKGYSCETRSDMQTAIETRLGILARGIIGKVFQCRHGISVEHLLSTPCVIELDILPADQMRLLVLFILVWIRLYLKTASTSAGDLRYVILIEEAHVIFGTRSQGGASEEMADTNAVVADVISRLLVELRALGVGIILSDQHPSALDPAASKSVASKLAFRQVHSEDREELGQSMLFREREMQGIARAEPGEASFFTEGYFGPRRIRTPNLGAQMRLTPRPSDAELLQCIRNQPWFKQAATQRIGDELEQLQEAVDRLDEDRQRTADAVQRLLNERRGLLTQPSDTRHARRLAEMTGALCSLRRKTVLSRDRFIRGPCRRFRHATESLDGLEPPELRALGRSLARRCQSLMQTDVPGLTRIIDTHIPKLKDSH